jgi:hypothetical protein
MSSPVKRTRASPTKRLLVQILLPLFVTGFAIGCLAGLSVAPIVANLIAVLLAFIVAVTALSMGVTVRFLPTVENNLAPPRSAWKGNPWPISFLTMGILFGSIAGVSIRESGWFWSRSRDVSGISKGPPSSNSGVSVGLNAGKRNLSFDFTSVGLLSDSELTDALKQSTDPQIELLRKHFWHDQKALINYVRELAK